MNGVPEVIYKSHTVRDEFCTVCQSFLLGNGSMVLPWRCACGEYEFDWAKVGYVHPTAPTKTTTNKGGN